MTSVQMHLALTHVPVILSLAGLVMLVGAFFMKNNTLTKTSYIVLLISAITTLPVFFTGEGTEEAIENLPGVSEAVIERHEEIAKLALISIAAGGAVALAALFFSRWLRAARFLKVGVLLFAIVSGVLMVQTAHLGGQIRHTEIRSNVSLQSDQVIGGDNAVNETGQEQKDED